jgi:hypothetical protein
VKKTAAKLEGRLAPHPQASEEAPAGGDEFSALQEAADFSVANPPAEGKAAADKGCN